MAATTRGASLEEYLTLQEIADELKVHIETVREWIRNKQLPAYKFGRDYRVERADYEQFKRERRTIDNEK